MVVALDPSTISKGEGAALYVERGHEESMFHVVYHPIMSSTSTPLDPISTTYAARHVDYMLGVEAEHGTPAGSQLGTIAIDLEAATSFNILSSFGLEISVILDGFGTTPMLSHTIGATQDISWRHRIYVPSYQESISSLEVERDFRELDLRTKSEVDRFEGKNMKRGQCDRKVQEVENCLRGIGAQFE